MKRFLYPPPRVAYSYITLWGVQVQTPKHGTRRTDQIDHDLDHLERNLPLGYVLQDLFSTYPTPGNTS